MLKDMQPIKHFGDMNEPLTNAICGNWDEEKGETSVEGFGAEESTTCPKCIEILKVRHEE